MCGGDKKSRADEMTRVNENGQEGGTNAEDEADAEHLEDLEDGAGCVEIWEKLGEKRND